MKEEERFWEVLSKKKFEEKVYLLNLCLFTLSLRKKKLFPSPPAPPRTPVMNCALSTRSTSALRAPTRTARSGRKAVAPRALSDVNVVIGGGKEEESQSRSLSLSLSRPFLPPLLLEDASSPAGLVHLFHPA